MLHKKYFILLEHLFSYNACTKTLPKNWMSICQLFLLCNACRRSNAWCSTSPAN